MDLIKDIEDDKETCAATYRAVQLMNEYKMNVNTLDYGACIASMRAIAEAWANAANALEAAVERNK